MVVGGPGNGRVKLAASAAAAYREGKQLLQQQQQAASAAALGAATVLPGQGSAPTAAKIATVAPPQSPPAGDRLKENEEPLVERARFTVKSGRGVQALAQLANMNEQPSCFLDGAPQKHEQQQAQQPGQALHVEQIEQLGQAQAQAKVEEKPLVERARFTVQSGRGAQALARLANMQ